MFYKHTPTQARFRVHSFINATQHSKKSTQHKPDEPAADQNTKSERMKNGSYPFLSLAHTHAHAYTHINTHL